MMNDECGLWNMMRVTHVSGPVVILVKTSIQ